MPVESPSLFGQVIQDHLALKRRNAELEKQMPISRYLNDDPFGNHPLFKSEEQARLEETMDGQLHADDLPAMLEWPREETPASDPVGSDGLWSKSRDFDWGD